jgi:hypothetical protein
MQWSYVACQWISPSYGLHWLWTQLGRHQADCGSIQSTGLVPSRSVINSECELYIHWHTASSLGPREYPGRIQDVWGRDVYYPDLRHFMGLLSWWMQSLTHHSRLSPLLTECHMTSALKIMSLNNLRLNQLILEPLSLDSDKVASVLNYTHAMNTDWGGGGFITGYS